MNLEMQTARNAVIKSNGTFECSEVFNPNMSFFDAPIASIRDESGKIRKYATTIPSRTVDVQAVFQLITCDGALAECTERVRRHTEEADVRRIKAQQLPYITPFGVFSRRRSDCLQQLSGLIPVDVDHLSSYQEACQLRDVLFEDPWLHTVLAFVSPSGLGVKALVDYRLTDDREEDLNRCREATLSAMDYVSSTYKPSHEKANRGVDRVGRDLARACFLCHDENARLSIF